MGIFDRQTKRGEAGVLKPPTPSLILGELRNELLSRKSPRVLDLGRAHDSNIQFYSSLSAKIRYEDLVTPITERATRIIEDADLFADLKKVFEGDAFDLIVVWDLFQYLSREEIKELGAILTTISHPETRLFSLISIRPEIPDTPLMFKINNDCILSQSPVTQTDIKSPRYTQRDLEQLLPNFHRHRSVLLRNGMEESIFYPNKQPQIKSLNA